MRITELLDKRSISLTAAPKTKKEALDQIIDLMVESGKINDTEAYREQVYATGNVTRSRSRGWRRWSSETAWTSTPWMISQSR